MMFKRGFLRRKPKYMVVCNSVFDGTKIEYTDTLSEARNISKDCEYLGASKEEITINEYYKVK